ncbi:amidase enhancer precursor [Ruminiclostridium hungatei]|uniref:Amidase enhancer n=1 Tax=Ruminiclostridium hungatei TaxID=48256 RepID=A0A1V4SIQ8_RUMHU|nr:SpoIID/LytB domain-containing protein [Ruminiclostridium hungatei]OPX43137.1 amidase enhancer precursor [Ruminiclostridium hungatei]
MKKICLLLSMVFFTAMFSGISSPLAYAASNPAVKIGLYFGSTAQSQILISSDKGVEYNAYDASANTNTKVYESSPGQALNIRKDSYFTGSGAKLTAAAAAANSTVGPYHLKLQSTYNSYNDTVPVVNSYKQKGIVAYPVFTDSGWNIWTGFYVDNASAQAAISEVKGKLGQVECTVVDKVDTRICGADSSTGEVVFMFAAAQKLLRGKSLDENGPVKIGTAKLNTYRGQVEFFRVTGSDMTVINVLPMEQYLYGVVPNEIESYSNVEALKAQAVAARTYAYLNLTKTSKSNTHLNYGFNLCSDIHCQVYRGMGSENANTNTAVDQTKDMVITYNGQLIEAVYSASSGGRTEDGSNVWTGAPYLKSVEDKYESGNSPKYNWTLTFTADEISQKLKNYNIGDVTSIEVTRLSEAGRPIELIVKGTLKPEGIKFTKDGCRTFMSLYSQWYTITSNADVTVLVDGKEEKKQLGQLTIISADGKTKSVEPGQSLTVIDANGKASLLSAVPTEYTFTGRGYGHAVGMSQEGAKGMANAGFKFDEILTHYYTGTMIDIKK